MTQNGSTDTDTNTRQVRQVPADAMVEIRCNGQYRKRKTVEPELCNRLLATVNKLPSCELQVETVCHRCGKKTRWGVNATYEATTATA